jgi:peptidoglycan/LPS O-acetylase OafA/YrhL
MVAQPNHTAMVRSAALDALRGAAILEVVLYHYAGRWTQPGSIASILRLCWSGVDLFFVLSGYLIAGNLMDNRHATNYYTTFYARRAARILPLYAICVLLMLPDYASGKWAGPLWPYLTLTQNFTWPNTSEFPWTMGATWSLAVEEQFYLVFPLIIRLMPPRRLPAILFGLAMLAPVARPLAVAAYGDDVAAYVLLPCRMDSLLFGALAACAMRHNPTADWLRAHRTMLWTLAAVGACGCSVPFMIHDATDPMSPLMRTVGYSWIAAFYTSVLLLIVTAQKSPIGGRRGPLALLGTGAYSMYLFHLPLVPVVGQSVAKVVPNYLVAISATSLALLALSATCWFVIERPIITSVRHRWKYADAASVGAEPAQSGAGN